MPKVSVIIATYNSEKTLEAAIKSVLNQSFNDWECIIVDGDSTDRTVEIAKRYADADPRIRYISEPDQGIYDAFNKGWQNAKGEWIHYLGSDDLLLPDGLKSLIEAAETCDAIYGTTELRFGFGDNHHQGNLPSTKIPKRMPACHQAIIMRRSLIEQLGGFRLKYRIVGDFDLVQRAFKLGATFKRIPETVCSYFVGGTSTGYTGLHETRRMFIDNKLHPYPNADFIWLYAREVLVRLKRYIKKKFHERSHS